MTADNGKAEPAGFIDEYNRSDRMRRKKIKRVRRPKPDKRNGN